MNHTEMADNISTNLEIERSRLGLTQAQFAEKLEMSLSSYKRIINCETTKLDVYTAYLIYKITGKYTCELAGYRDSYIDVGKKLKFLSKRQLNYIDALTDVELAFANSITQSGKNPDDYIPVLIPTGNMKDGMYLDSCNSEEINISHYRKIFGSELHFGIKITSNHLHPVYHKDDIILISRNPIRDGDTGIFLNTQTHCAYIRKFHQTSPCSLEPINNYGETFYVDSNDVDDMNKWIKFGYVLTKIR